MLLLIDVGKKIVFEGIPLPSLIITSFIQKLLEITNLGNRMTHGTHFLKEYFYFGKVSGNFALSCDRTLQ
jgi:hypothetical protein